MQLTRVKRCDLLSWKGRASYIRDVFVLWDRVHHWRVCQTGIHYIMLFQLCISALAVTLVRTLQTKFQPETLCQQPCTTPGSLQ